MLQQRYDDDDQEAETEEEGGAGDVSITKKRTLDVLSLAAFAL